MSFYERYLRERTDDEIIENNSGFCTYRFLGGSQVYIIDIYTDPDFRKSGAAARLADEVVHLAKQRGCTELLGTVVPSAKNSTASLLVLLAYGMTLKSAGPDLIIFRKDI